MWDTVHPRQKEPNYFNWGSGQDSFATWWFGQGNSGNSGFMGWNAQPFQLPDYGNYAMPWYPSNGTGEVLPKGIAAPKPEGIPQDTSQRPPSEQVAINAQNAQKRGISYDPATEPAGSVVAAAQRMVLQAAQGRLRYVFGGGRGDPSTTDCSDFVARAVSQGTGGKVQLPAQTDAMYAVLKDNKPIRVQSGQVVEDGPRPGDIVFFGGYNDGHGNQFGHVGIVQSVDAQGRVWMLHASSPERGVRGDYVDDIARALGATVTYRRLYTGD